MASSRIGLLLATVVVAVAAMTGGVSYAGTYDVPACDAAGGVNNSWFPVITGAVWVTAYTQCPSGGDASRGMVLRNVVQAGSVSGGVQARLQFTAPPGTSIVGIRASDDFFRASARWEAALSTGSQILRGCGVGGYDTCGWRMADEWVDVPASNVLYIDVYCPGNSCPLDSGSTNHSYVEAAARLYSAVVRLRDDSAPSIGSVGGGLWTDGWKRGTQTVTFDASDNSGIRQTAVLIDGQSAGQDAHTCDATQTVPCPNGGASFAVNTAGLSDGAHQLSVQAVDSAGNPAAVSRAVLVDNTPPGAPQAVNVDGGEGWHAANAFVVRWTNPKVDGAPVAAAAWQLCPASGVAASCVTGTRTADAVSSLQDLKVPGDGDWLLRVWLVDQAGNQTQGNAAAPVHLKLDDEAPSTVFSPRDPADPATVAIQASDGVSGVASGSVEIKPQASQTWTTVPARLDGGRLVATLPDETLADGAYDVRGHAVDLAGNERTTTTLADGTAMAVRMPVRAVTLMTGGHPRRRRGHGQRSRVMFASSVRLTYARGTRLRGLLIDAAGRPMAGTALQVLQQTALPGTPWTLAGTLTTSTAGAFSYATAARGTSRSIRVRYPGTPTIRPSQVDVRIDVAASSTIHASRHVVRAGRVVRFSGGLRGGGVPAGGKLVQLQVLVNGRWQVFANPRSDQHGRWRFAYRFSGHYRSARYAFRVRVPRDPAYPFVVGHSATLRVLVRGP